MRLRSTGTESRAVPFPFAATAGLRSLACADPPPPPIVERAANVLRSFRDAPAQRQQSAALKLLGGILREDHPRGGGDTRCPLCDFVAPVLAALVLDNAVSSYTVSCAALRALMRTRCPQGSSTPPQLFLALFEGLFVRLEAWGSHDGGGGEGGTNPILGDVDRRVRDVRALVAIVGEPECRVWIYGQLGRLHGAAVLGFDILRDAFDESLRMSQHSRTALDAVVISALQLLQDACRTASDIVVGRLNGRGCADGARCTPGKDAVRLLLPVVRDIPALCFRISASSNLQRRNAMASAVLSVSSNCCGAIVSSSEALSVDEAMALVEEKVLIPAQSLAPLNQLFLLRAVIESPDLAVARKRLLPSFLERFCDLCSGNADLSLRYMSMESVVLSLRHFTRGSLDPNMRDRVLDLVRDRWEESYSGISSQMRDTVDALLALDVPDKVRGQGCYSFWLNYALELLDKHSSSVGMYSPMSRILGRISAKDLVRARPGVQASVLSAVASDSTAAKPAAEWLECFWRSLLREENVAASGRGEGDEGLRAFSALTAGTIVGALVDKLSGSQRERISMYVIPAYFRACEGSEESVARGVIAVSREMFLSDEDRILVLVVLLSACQRACGSYSGVFSHTDVFSQLRSALESDDSEIRLGALELIVCDRTPSSPVEWAESDLVLGSLPTLLFPGAGRAEISRVQRRISKFLERVWTSLSAAESCGGWWSREKKLKYGGKRTAEFEEKRVGYVQFAGQVLADFLHRFLAFSHPCAAPERRRMAIELLRELVALASVESILDNYSALPKASVVTNTVRLIADEWEPCRTAALVIASSLTGPSFGLDRGSLANSLLKRAVGYVRSPRLSEAEPGAAVCRLVFRKAFSDGKYLDDPILFPSPKSLKATSCTTREGPTSESVSSLYPQPAGEMQFFASILQAMYEVAGAAKVHLPTACMSGLFFGDARVLRVCMADADWASICADPAIGVAAVRSLAQSIVQCLGICIREALKGLDLETNVLNGDSFDGNSAILLGDEHQKVSTACYLSAKEICMALGVVAERMGSISGCSSRLSEGSASPISPRMEDEVNVLGVDDMEAIGSLFTLILSSVRHNGVLNGASDGYEHVCSHLLLSTDGKFHSLPLAWARTALDAAMRGDMYTLRRSAGVPYFVLGAVRAEGRIAQRGQCGGTAILSELVQRLLEKLYTAGFSQTDPALVAASSKPLSFEGADEDAVVHCLNVLKFITSDGAVAKPMTRFLARCVMVAIQGFNTTSWLVRNSAFILYGALVRRSLGVGIGDRRDLLELSSRIQFPGASSMRVLGVTSPQFFSRYPELHSFLLTVLEGAIVPNGTACHHRALFPAIYMLSCLSPSSGAEQDEALSIRAFASAVERCLGAPAESVRRAAATASVPLICDASVVAGQVDEAFTCRLPAASSMGQNRLHGELLRLGAILKDWCFGALLTTEMKGEIVGILANRLPAASWIAVGENGNRCPVTRAAMLRVMRRAVKVAAIVLSSDNSPQGCYRAIEQAGCKQAASKSWKMTCEQLLTDCLLVGERCLDEYARDHLPSVSEIIGMPAALRGAAKLCLGVVNVQVQHGLTVHPGVRNGQFFDNLLRHSATDVREMTLKLAVQWPVLSGLSEWPQFVWDRIVEMISHERDMYVLQGALRLAHVLISGGETFADGRLLVVNTQKRRLAETHFPACVVARILKLSSESSFLDVRESALILLGVCVRDARIQSKCSGYAIEQQSQLVTKWLELLESASCALSVPSTRVSAAKSLEESMVLFDHSSEKGQVQATAQLLVLRLMQDENRRVRVCSKRLARQMADIASGGMLDTLPCLLSVHENMDIPRQSEALVHVENVLGLGPTSSTPEGVLHRLFETPRSSKVMYMDAASEVSRCDLDSGNMPGTKEAPDKLFRDDVENLNHEAEVFVQLAAWKLRKVSTGLKASLSTEHQNWLSSLMQGWGSDLGGAITSLNTVPAFHGVFKEEASSSFSSIHQLVCRLFATWAVIDCPMSDLANSIEQAFHSAERIASEMHPVLYTATASLVSLLRYGSGVDDDMARSHLGNILFLIL